MRDMCVEVPLKSYWLARQEGTREHSHANNTISSLFHCLRQRPLRTPRLLHYLGVTS